MLFHFKTLVATLLHKLTFDCPRSNQFFNNFVGFRHNTSYRKFRFFILEQLKLSHPFLNYLPSLVSSTMSTLTQYIQCMTVLVFIQFLL